MGAWHFCLHVKPAREAHEAIWCNTHSGCGTVNPNFLFWHNAIVNVNKCQEWPNNLNNFKNLSDQLSSNSNLPPTHCLFRGQLRAELHFCTVFERCSGNFPYLFMFHILHHTTRLQVKVCCCSVGTGNSQNYKETGQPESMLYGGYHVAKLKSQSDCKVRVKVHGHSTFQDGRSCEVWWQSCASDWSWGRFVSLLFYHCYVIGCIRKQSISRTKIMSIHQIFLGKSVYLSCISAFILYYSWSCQISGHTKATHRPNNLHWELHGRGGGGGGQTKGNVPCPF